jgi:hypothetical protein
MNRSIAKPRLTQLALLTLAALAGHAVAATPTVIDPATEVLKRLKQTNVATNDGFSLSSVKFLGDLNTTGLRFTLPSVVPDTPKVLMQGRVSNCNDREVTGRADVNEATENSETFSKSYTIGSTTTVQVGYESPVGVSASASQSLEISGTKGEERTSSKTLSWNVGNDVPVGPRQAVVWQFVVSGKELNNIPWSTDVIVGGPVDLGYTKPAGNTTVCLHEHHSYGGKKKCFTTNGEFTVSNFKNVDWEGSTKGSINDEVTSVSITGAAKVTLYQHTDFKGWTTELTSSSANVGKDRNDKFSSIKIQAIPQTKSVRANLEALLPDAQRRIALSGTYKGVNGVMGDFRAGAPVALTDADCRVTPAAASAGAPPAAAAMRSSTLSAPRAATGGLQGVTPLQGARILRSGVAPTAVR